MQIYLHIFYFYIYVVANHDLIACVPLIRKVIRVQVPLTIVRVPIRIHQDDYRFHLSVPPHIFAKISCILFDN